jgi:hypothetical protein
MRRSVGIAIGAGTFAVLQTIWSLGHANAGWPGAWITRSGDGVITCFSVYSVIGVFVVAYRYNAPELVKRAMAVTVGATVAIVAASLSVGGLGNLWLPVVAVNSAIVGAATIVGGVVAAMIKGKHAA